MAVMNDCIFCVIANGPAEKLIWQNEVAAAFKDLHPKAPVHILVVPKRHIQNFDDLTNSDLAAQMTEAVQVAAREAGLAGAYKIHVNVGEKAGQVVGHLHFHLLGGYRPEQLEEVRKEEL
jgi:histidine triad (HIT) family protein